MTTTSLFERLGGKAAVEAAVDLFYQKVLADPGISHFFEGTDMRVQRGKQKAFLITVFGGPAIYTGKDLRRAHAPLVERGLTECRRADPGPIGLRRPVPPAHRQGGPRLLPQRGRDPERGGMAGAERPDQSSRRPAVLSDRQRPPAGAAVPEIRPAPLSPKPSALSEAARGSPAKGRESDAFRRDACLRPRG